MKMLMGTGIIGGVQDGIVTVVDGDLATEAGIWCPAENIPVPPGHNLMDHLANIKFDSRFRYMTVVAEYAVTVSFQAKGQLSVGVTTHTLGNAPGATFMIVLDAVTGLPTYGGVLYSSVNAFSYVQFYADTVSGGLYCLERYATQYQASIPALSRSYIVYVLASLI